MDSGKFELGPGSGSMADILGIRGKVQVHAVADLLQQNFSGSIVIPKASTLLAGESDDGDVPVHEDKNHEHGHDDDDDDDDDDE